MKAHRITSNAGGLLSLSAEKAELLTAYFSGCFLWSRVGLFLSSVSSLGLMAFYAPKDAWALRPLSPLRWQDPKLAYPCGSEPPSSREYRPCRQQHCWHWEFSNRPAHQPAAETKHSLISCFKHFQRIIKFSLGALWREPECTTASQS